MADNTRDRWHSTEVRSFSGYRANERPLSFTWGDREVGVVAVSASHRDPDHLYFKVNGDDGGRYTLRHHEYLDTWQVTELKDGLQADRVKV